MAELYGQRIQTTVQTKYLPYVVDTVLNSNVLFKRVIRGAKKWSGRTLRVPVKVSKNTTGTSFRGFDTFSTSATDNRQYMEFTPAFYQITCALPGDELSVADTEDKVLDLMKLTIQSDTEDMADDLGTIFYSDGTGNALPEGAFATDPVTATVDKAWGFTVGDESWGEFVEPGGKGSQIADPLDLFGFQAGTDAAKAQANAAMKAQRFLQDQYKTLVGLQSPFIQGGQQAFGLQGALSGLQGPEAQQQAMQQFQQAQQGAVNYGSQVGGWEGMPNVQGAIGDYAKNIANQDYDNYFNRLGGIAGMGQSSASALGGVTTDANQGIAQTMQAGGDARTNAILMQNQLRAQGLGNIATLGGAALQSYGSAQNAKNSKLGVK